MLNKTSEKKPGIVNRPAPQHAEVKSREDFSKNLKELSDLFLDIGYVEEELNYKAYHEQIKESAKQFLNEFDKKEEEKNKLSTKIEVEDCFTKDFWENAPRSYNEMSAFVGALIHLNIIAPKDFLNQINKCEKWSDDDFKNIRAKIDSLRFYLSSLDQIKHLIQEANLKVEEKSKNTIQVRRFQGETEIIVDGHSYIFNNEMSRVEKAAIIQNMFSSGVAESFIKNFTTPELSKEDICYWKDHYLSISTESIDPNFSESKKQSKISKEVEKINRLLSEKKIKIKDLEKYVALGLITSSGLKAWRIEDQAKNNYFYDEIDRYDDDVYSLNNKELKFLDELTNKELRILDELLNSYPDEKAIPSRFESEIQQAAYRVASQQLNNVTRTAIIKSIPPDRAEAMKSFLSSELGSSFVGMVGGLTLTYAMKDNATAQTLAKELRTSSLAVLGNEAIDALKQNIFDTVKKAIAEIPPNEIRVSNENIEDLEILHEEEKQNILNQSR